MKNPLYWVAENRLDDEFPNTDQALIEPDGLLAVGGDLSINRLLCAYQRGIFPWYSDGQPILWWAPNPRAVMVPAEVKISRSLRKTLRRGKFRVTFDQTFAEVIDACAMPRDGQAGTWITSAMRGAYIGLHQQGGAHSVECWLNDTLMGGLYGVAVGRVFFGESMFSRSPDASKVALVVLAQALQVWGFELIDCQIHSEHLSKMGAILMRRIAFEQKLHRLVGQQVSPDAWHDNHAGHPLLVINE